MKTGILLIIALFACGRETGFVDIEKKPSSPVEEQQDVSSANVKDEDQNTRDTSDDSEREVIEFVQNAPGKIDILWVIDNSSSMQPLQDSLRNNISAFIEQISLSELDYSIGLTSTSICPTSEPADLSARTCPQENQSGKLNHRGSLVGENGQKVLKKGDAQLVQKFRQRANLGTTGSSFEHGLSAVRAVVQKSLTGQNEDFIRSDAFLSVIVVSDEEDDGVGLSRTNEQGINYWQRNLTRYYFDSAQLYAFLNQTNASKGFSVSTIVGTEGPNGEGCPYDGGKISEVGKEYQKISDLSGGIKASICTTQWNESLKTLGENLRSQMDSIKLTLVPKVETILVTVDGQTNEQWRYVVGNNSIQFFSGHVPRAGAAVKVSFFPENSL